MNIKKQRCNAVDCNGDALRAYHHLRLIWVVYFFVGVCLASLVIVMLFGTKPEGWKNILYGMNRIYLAMLIILWVGELWMIFMWLTNWDERKIQAVIQNQRLRPSEVIEDLNQGKIFYGYLTDNILIANTYSLFYLKQKYTIICNREIAKLAMDKQNVNGKVTDVLVCTLQSGIAYDIPMNKSTIVSAAQYFKQVMMMPQEAKL